MERIVIDCTEVYGIEASLRGMRNPMDSWHLSDSQYNLADELYEIGDKDLDLAVRLTKAGSEHCKFLRQIHVWCDITVPRYIWSELDTYKFSTKNSCSTMHKLFNKKSGITLDLFIYEEEDEDELRGIIQYLNGLRDIYLVTKDNKILERAKQLLPEGLLQKRTWATNYQELLNIYFQRRHHRLEAWKPLCKWIEELPYMRHFIGAIEDKHKHDRDYVSGC